MNTNRPNPYELSFNELLSYALDADQRLAFAAAANDMTQADVRRLSEICDTLTKALTEEKTARAAAANSLNDLQWNVNFQTRRANDLEKKMVDMVRDIHSTLAAFKAIESAAREISSGYDTNRGVFEVLETMTAKALKNFDKRYGVQTPTPYDGIPF